MIAQRVALIGCGMIGGSLLARLRQHPQVQAARAVGYDLNPEHARALQVRGIVDEVAPAVAMAARGAQLILLAVPVGAMAEVLAALAPESASAELIMDVGSTKLDVMALAGELLPDASRFIGAHPMAGSERSGPDALDPALFEGRAVLLTRGGKSRPESEQLCAELWRFCGARTSTMTAAQHDRAMAWVSHLPHAVAFALAAAVGAIADEVKGLSGGGFADTTRIAGSDPTMWRDIFIANRAPLLTALDAFGEELTALRRTIEDGDGAAIAALVARAGAGRARVMKKLD